MSYKSIGLTVVSALFFFPLSAKLAMSDDAILANGFQLKVDKMEEMGDTIRLYLSGGGYVEVQSSDIKSYEHEKVPVAEKTSTLVDDVSTPSAILSKIPTLLAEAGHRQGLDPDLLKSMIAEESGFNPTVVSRKGAGGLMQLMPQTASELGVANVFHPGENVQGGAQYIRSLIDRYQGDLAKALAAYNAGPAAVDRYQGIPPFKETQSYVRRVITRYNREKTGK